MKILAIISAAHSALSCLVAFFFMFCAAWTPATQVNKELLLSLRQTAAICVIFSALSGLISIMLFDRIREEQS